MNPQTWSDFLLLIAIRYFAIGGAVWLTWYVWLKRKIAFKKIQLKFPTNKDYRRELLYSASTVLIFSFVPAIMLLSPVKKYTLYYSDSGLHSLAYFWLAFPLMFLVHDAYFYFTHRLMHHKKIFRHFHLVHHRSVNPSPWAALSFHPLEAVVESGIFALLLVIMPLTIWHLMVFFLLQMIYDIYGHLGWEIYPKDFNKTMVGKWVNTSVNHNLHHQYNRGSYGLYFLWWDRLFGTLRPEYDDRFKEVKNRNNG